MLACMVISSINRSEPFGRRRDDGERNQWKIYLQNCSDENNELREHLQYINSVVALRCVRLLSPQSAQTPSERNVDSVHCEHFPPGLALAAAANH